MNKNRKQASLQRLIESISSRIGSLEGSEYIINILLEAYINKTKPGSFIQNFLSLMREGK